jgi:uncharacterized membrane-anchored protein
MSHPNLLRALQQLENGDRESAHAIAQDDASMLGSWLHGIVHLHEGDLGNARYWYARAHRRFPQNPSWHTEVVAIRKAIAAETDDDCDDE